MDIVLVPSGDRMGIYMDLIIEINMKNTFIDEDKTDEQIREEERAKIYALLNPHLKDGWAINVQTRVVK
jgi:hypothetical protein